MVRKSKYARRQRDHAYFAWIRSLPCLVCGRIPSEAAHLGTRSFGQKCSDRHSGPLCAWDHRLGHTRMTGSAGDSVTTTASIEKNSSAN